MERSRCVSDILGRLDAVIAIFENLQLEALNKPHLHKYMSQTNVNNLKQYIYNLFFIFKAVRISLFDLIKQSGKVDYQKGGNPYQMMFRIFVIIIVLAAKTIASSNELVVNSQNADPILEWTNRVVEYSVTNVIEIPGAKNTPILFGLTYKSQLNADLTKLFQNTQRDVYSLLKPIRSKCLTHVKQNKMSMHTEYINLPNGLQEIDSIIENPTSVDKNTQSAACFEINPLPFNFNPETGNIEFIHVNMPLDKISEILYTILGDMNSVLKVSKPTPNKEFVEAYNGLLIIANGLEKIRELLFDIFSPVVFNPNMPNEYRLESLEDSFGAIINEMAQMKDLLNLKNPQEQMEANAKLDYANEEFQNEEMIALARETSRKAKKIKSEQNVKDTSAYYENQFDERIAPVKTIGKKALEVPVELVGAVSDAAVNTVLAPVNSVLKGAKETVMNNKFISALLALGVFVTGVVSIQIAKNKLTIIYKVANAIKTIVLLPITIPISIGTKLIKVVWYRPVEETPIVNPILSIDNGPVDEMNRIVDVVPPFVEPVPEPITIVKRKTKKDVEKQNEIEKLEMELARVVKMYSDFENKGIKDKLPGIQRGITQITEKLDSLNKARGTRKRINHKNTKKNKKRLQTKPSRRKFKPRK